jgi:hypothetical protein
LPALAAIEILLFGYRKYFNFDSYFVYVVNTVHSAVKQIPLKGIRLALMTR